MIRILVILLKFHKNFDFKDFDQNSSVFQSENLMTMEFLWNSRKLQEKFNQYSDQKIRWPRNSYEILENYRKSLDIPKIPTSACSSKTFSSLFYFIFLNEKKNVFKTFAGLLKIYVGGSFPNGTFGSGKRSH